MGRGVYQFCYWVGAGCALLMFVRCGVTCSLSVDNCSVTTDVAQPTAFAFTDRTDVGLNTSISSNTITLGGFTAPLSAVCKGCSGLLRNGALTESATVVLPGDTLALVVQSSSQLATKVTATLIIGGFTAPSWGVTTVAGGTPNFFSFTNRTDTNLATLVVSNTVTLTGSFQNAVATCVGCSGISRNGGVFGGGQQSGFQTGDTITVRATSSASYGATTNVTVTVGSTQTTWSITTLSQIPGDPCNSSPVVGQGCADGTVYAGLSPDGNVPMFTTPCDAGQTFDSGSSSCLGVVSTLKWCGTVADLGLQSTVLGRSNTAALVLLNAAPTGPYPAATYCRNLSFGGHSDWYLPAQDEAGVLAAGYSAIGGFGLTGYWTSTQGIGGSTTYGIFSSGIFGNADGSSGFLRIRCVRRD